MTRACLCFCRKLFITLFRLVCLFKTNFQALLAAFKVIKKGVLATMIQIRVTKVKKAVCKQASGQILLANTGREWQAERTRLLECFRFRDSSEEKLR